MSGRGLGAWVMARSSSVVFKSYSDICSNWVSVTELLSFVAHCSVGYMQLVFFFSFLFLLFLCCFCQFSERGFPALFPPIFFLPYCTLPVPYLEQTCGIPLNSIRPSTSRLSHRSSSSEISSHYFLRGGGTYITIKINKIYIYTYMKIKIYKTYNFDFFMGV